MTLQEIKMYLRVDGNEDDVLINTLQGIAEEYLLNAGIEKDYTKKLYGLAVMLLISNYYENRQLSSDTAKIELTYGLKSIIIQLQLQGVIHYEPR